MIRATGWADERARAGVARRLAVVRAAALVLFALAAAFEWGAR